MSRWLDMLGTTKTILSIGIDGVSLDSVGLTAPRTFTFPDASGKLLIEETGLTPTKVLTTEKLYVPANKQVLFSAPIEFDAGSDFVIDGHLIEVS